MGNIFGQTYGRTEWQPNIPMDHGSRDSAGSVNDLNRPHSTQLRDMVLHYGIPLLCMAALGK